MNNSKINVKDIAIAAMLTALSITIPMFMPFKIVLDPIFSATFASHVPGILAMFVSPFAVVATAIGSAIGFMMCGLGPWVAARALMHMVFGLVGYQFIKKKYNIFFIAILAGLIHAASEMLVGVISIPFVLTPKNGHLYNILVAVGLGTFIHHCIDFVISVVIARALIAANAIKCRLNFTSFKQKQ